MKPKRGCGLRLPKSDLAKAFLRYLFKIIPLDGEDMPALLFRRTPRYFHIE